MLVCKPITLLEMVEKGVNGRDGEVILEHMRSNSDG